jgi:hypothetical protein
MKRNLAVILIVGLLVPFCQREVNNGPGQNDDGMTKIELWSAETRLRGANIYQRRVYPELDGDTFMGAGPVGPPYTQEDFDKLAQMGANCVNISHPGIFSEQPPYQLDTAILNHLEDLVQMIGQADMFAVIAFRTGPGRSEFTFFWGEDDDWFDKSYYNDRIWRQPAAQAAWAEMWQAAAQHFRDSPYVVGYDLMVEPNANEVWLDTWDPEEFYREYAHSLYDWNQLYPQVVTAIREIDDRTPILVGAMSYSAVEWLPYMALLDDDKVVYMVHQYAPHVYTHQQEGENIDYPGRFDADYDGSPEYVDKDWLKGLLSIVDDFKTQNNAAVSANEFGLVRWAPGGHTFLDDLMDLFEQRGMNHALWVWDPSWPAWTEEVNAFNFRFGPNPHNTSDMETNALIEVIRKYWHRNSLRPESVDFGHEGVLE